MYNKTEKSLFLANGVWELTDTEVKAGVLPRDIQYLLVTFHIRRRASFYLVNMLLPIATMGVLNLLVFLLPAKSGERVGYSITMLLAIAVFLTIAADNLPKTSFPTISILCLKLLFDMMISGLVILFTIVGLRFYHTDENKPVPRCVAAITRVLLCKRSCKRWEEKGYRQNKVYNRTGHIAVVDKDDSQHHNDNNKNDIKMQSRMHYDDLRENKCRELPRLVIDGAEEDNRLARNVGIVDTITWNDVGRASDVFFFCFTLLAFAVSHAAYIVYSHL